MSHLELDMWHWDDKSLVPILTKWVGRGEEKGAEEQTVRERKEWDFFKREALPSL